LSIALSTKPKVRPTCTLRRAIAEDFAALHGAGIHTSQLFRWQQQLCEPGPISATFTTGGRMRITGWVDAPTVTALMKALAKGK
jgi:hypothetical protein